MHPSSPSPAESRFLDRTQNPDLRVQSPERLAAVQFARVLDAPREETFDAVTRLAARLVGVPASFISIAGADRDFYLSDHGFPDALHQAREMQGRTFCHYTLSGDEPLVIDDTHAHPEWRAVPTVDSLGVRAYVGVPLKVDGQQIGSFCVIDTEPREWDPAEIEALKQLARSVEREIRLRLAVEQATAEAAYSLNMARSRESMAAAVVHDLRTPLQILQLGLAVLKRTSDDQDQSVIKRMEAAVGTMRNMADSLLADTGAIPENMLVKRRITALELAADATGMMTPIAESAGISLSFAELPDAVLEVEYAQMLRVLGNLIGNSIKYSRPASKIVVRGAREGRMIRIAVHDEGRGMSAEELTRAFERGYQGGEGMIRGDGAGLGLGIVRQLVEKNGGSVSLQSELGRGTVATISLPCFGNSC